MKVAMNEEEFNKGVAGFLSVYYKESLKSKSVKDLGIICAFSISLLIALCFMTGDKKTALTLLGLVFGGVLIIVLTILIVGKVSKKRKYNITKVEYEFEDKIYVTSYIGSGSTNKEQYSYDSVEKVIETTDYFYLFVSKYAALTVKKTQDLNRDEFIELMINKNIAVKECK